MHRTVRTRQGSEKYHKTLNEGDEQALKCSKKKVQNKQLTRQIFLIEDCPPYRHLGGLDRMDQILPQEALPLWKRKWKTGERGRRLEWELASKILHEWCFWLSCFGQRKTAVESELASGNKWRLQFFSRLQAIFFKVAIFFNLIFLLSQLALTF